MVDKKERTLILKFLVVFIAIGFSIFAVLNTHDMLDENYSGQTMEQGYAEMVNVYVSGGLMDIDALLVEAQQVLKLPAQNEALMTHVVIFLSFMVLILLALIVFMLFLRKDVCMWIVFAAAVNTAYIGVVLSKFDSQKVIQESLTNLIDSDAISADPYRTKRLMDGQACWDEFSNGKTVALQFQIEHACQRLDNIK